MKKQVLYLLSFLAFSISSPAFAFENVVTHQPDDTIALTLDACGGATDWNILHFLKDNDIPATLFVTSKWINNNPEAVEFLKANQTIFKIENHGRDHKEAVYQKIGAYHLPAVVNAEGLNEEVAGGNMSIENTFNIHPTWYRDAGALYDYNSIEWLHEHHWKIGGYSVAADEGATASTARVIMLLSHVKPSDVILMHMNKPQGHTFEGMKVGILKLKNQGFKFAWLRSSEE